MVVKDNDELLGGDGDDYLSGDKGSDTLTGGGGSDVFLLQHGSGESSIASADLIADFELGTDKLGLSRGIQFEQLTITENTGGGVVIQVANTGDYLAVVAGVTELTADDFLVI
jgi:Ca2+-binding RTX toxin-like protein